METDGNNFAAWLPLAENPMERQKDRHERNFIDQHQHQPYFDDQ
jgi:hypothetical protein